jgi:hypothetical protein
MKMFIYISDDERKSVIDLINKYDLKFNEEKSVGCGNTFIIRGSIKNIRNFKCELHNIIDSRNDWL